MPSPVPELSGWWGLSLEWDIGLLSKFWCCNARVCSSYGCSCILDDVASSMIRELLTFLSQIALYLGFFFQYTIFICFSEIQKPLCWEGRLSDTGSLQNLAPSWFCQLRLASCQGLLMQSLCTMKSLCPPIIWNKLADTKLDFLI